MPVTFSDQELLNSGSSMDLYKCIIMGRRIQNGSTMFRHLCDMKAVHQAAYQARVQLHWHQRHHLPLCPGVAQYHSQTKGACPGTGAKQQQGIFQSSTNPMIPCGEQHAECQGKLFPHVGCHQRMQSGTHFQGKATSIGTLTKTMCSRHAHDPGVQIDESLAASIQSGK